jgi:LmbE family N-acetylglucosaminyl deacetylase/GT2 family glycosyltransferase
VTNRFPPLTTIDGLPRRVLVFAPHPDDEVLGCGGALALHARRGDHVRVVVVSDGAAGGDALVRTAEARLASEILGVSDWTQLGLKDGALERDPTLVEVLRRELEENKPELVYGPSPFELHSDHRALCAALAAALQSSGACRVHLYGVNRQVPANFLLDTTPVAEQKARALSAFESQRAKIDLVGKAEAFDRAYTVNVEDPAVERAEGFMALDGDAVQAYRAQVVFSLLDGGDEGEKSSEVRSGASAVISTWNKLDDVRANLEGLRAQTHPFEQIIVVDNASQDGTAAMINLEFPEVHLIVMPHSRCGACETFNIGFAAVQTELTAILDDDVVLPPNWLEGVLARLRREPETTAVISTKIIEPGMPEAYRNSPAVNEERYMSTFRGCASLARSAVLREAGYYDERLFIYGNERDLTCRILNLGYRVLQFPGVEAFHKTPFGVQMGKRSLYYHARNAWLGMIKYAPLSDLLRMPFLVVSRVLLRSRKSEEEGAVHDATGTIGIGRAVRETPGAWWILLRAGCSVLWNLPYCLRRRQPVRAPDFELPLH